MDTILLFLVVIFLLSGYAVYKNIKENSTKSNNISPPPPPPQVTPTVVMHNIIIGEACYYDLEFPEVFVTIIEADSNNVLVMLPDASTSSLPVSDFLLRYAPRVQTKICRER